MSSSNTSLYQCLLQQKYVYGKGLISVKWVFIFGLYLVTQSCIALVCDINYFFVSWDVSWVSPSSVMNVVDSSSEKFI